ncbi:sialidase family protein [Desulfohalovibrio reitneri]|uniref:sialidase family protein n=1 Tax=Desulfohalovibrio reitneri TaxID=1307759 RepID=UPI0004A773BC|nr:sialidase family protein [Desulfohalovibrio reitneri]
MRSLHGRSDRRVVIDDRPGHYLSFPDVLALKDGLLLCVYRETEGHHTPRRQRLLLRESPDGGRSWGEARILHPRAAHCPRIARLDACELAVINEAGRCLHLSLDEGRTWATQEAGGLAHDMLDRPMALDGERVLTCGHTHRGQAAQPRIAQAPAEQMAYLSYNRGRSFQPLSVLNHDPCLVLCEASLTRLPDGRILALLRENSGVYEPMYFVVSEDEGHTWSDPRPTPLIGHRPTVGLTASGKLLVTYRDVGPEPGVAAWLGDLSELGEFAVHGAAGGECAVIGDALECGAGARYALRPLTDPASARAELELDAEVLSGAVRVRFGGVWWRVERDGARAEASGARRLPLEKGARRLHFWYEPGRVVLRVDGRRRERRVAMDRDARPIILDSFGEKPRWLLRGMRQRVIEPCRQRDYLLDWNPEQGPPDAWAAGRVLELWNQRGVWGGDMGYSGWCEPEPGRFFCATHVVEPGEGYRRGFSSKVVGIHFNEDDFA